MRRLLKYLITFYYKIINLRKGRISSSAIVLRKCHFEGNNAVGDNTYLSGTSFGYGSYVGFGCEFSNCKIGKYCSLGSNVRVVSATHPVSGFVSTHPAFFSDSYRFRYVKKLKFQEHLRNEEGYECTIGNDVWIGDNVLILGGCKIGDGAIIGMGSLVLHDVAPYSVVAGVPAKEIRKRFSDDVIEDLKKIQWWNKPTEWIEQHAEEYSDVDYFLNKHCHK